MISRCPLIHKTDCLNIFMLSKYVLMSPGINTLIHLLNKKNIWQGMGKETCSPDTGSREVKLGPAFWK